MAKVRYTAEQIEAIYQAYPRHVGKLAALKAIRKALERPGVAYDWLLERTQAYVASAYVQDALGTDDEKFVPHPATWFNRGHFYDEVTPARKSRTPPGHSLPRPKMALTAASAAWLVIQKHAPKGVIAARYKGASGEAWRDFAGRCTSGGGPDSMEIGRGMSIELAGGRVQVVFADDRPAERACNAELEALRVKLGAS
jgi:hypothetical protein